MLRGVRRSYYEKMGNCMTKPGDDNASSTRDLQREAKIAAQPPMMVNVQHHVGKARTHRGDVEVRL